MLPTVEVSTGSFPVTDGRGHQQGSSEGEDVKDEGKCRASRGSAPFSIPTTRLSGQPELGKFKRFSLWRSACLKFAKYSLEVRSLVSLSSTHSAIA
jgi:hypothetical protein